MKIETHEENLITILPKPRTRLCVPYYQRGYSWGKDEIVDLWDDIIDTFSKGNEHFMGSIVLLSEDSEENEDYEKNQIIDGQQRIATLMIILSLIRDKAEENNFETFAGELNAYYIFNPDPEEESKKYKLIMNYEDREFFVAYVLKDLKDVNRKKETDYKSDMQLVPESCRLIWNAIEICRTKINELLEEDKRDMRELLKKLSMHIVRKLKFIMISVDSEENAFIIFETLNERGLELQLNDLVKNHLCMKVYGESLGPDEKPLIIDKWEAISNNLEKGDISEFLRYYWLSKKEIVTIKNMYKEFTNEVRNYNQQEIYNFVDELIKYSEYYQTFVDPSKEENEVIRERLESLKDLKAQKCYSLLLSARDVLDDRSFEKILKFVETLTFRYSTICGMDTKPLEKVYHDKAKELFEDGSNALDGVLGKLIGEMPDDEAFSNSFIKKRRWGISNQVQYMLRKMENSFGGEKIIKSSSKVWIEHIMPNAITNEWQNILGKSGDNLLLYDEYKERLGNITLLLDKNNIPAKNKTFTEKKIYFKKSDIKLTKELIEFKNWDYSSIEKRQEYLRDLALEIWSIPDV